MLHRRALFLQWLVLMLPVTAHAEVLKLVCNLQCNPPFAYAIDTDRGTVNGKAPSRGKLEVSVVF